MFDPPICSSGANTRKFYYLHYSLKDEQGHIYTKNDPSSDRSAAESSRYGPKPISGLRTGTASAAEYMAYALWAAQYHLIWWSKGICNVIPANVLQNLSHPINARTSNRHKLSLHLILNWRRMKLRQKNFSLPVVLLSELAEKPGLRIYLTVSLH